MLVWGVEVRARIGGGITVETEGLLFPVETLEDTLADDLLDEEEGVDAVDGGAGV